MTALILLSISGRCRGATEPAEEATSKTALVRVAEEVLSPARAAGAVTAVGVREGDAVKAGDLLLRIDDEEPRLAAERAEVELEFAKQRAANDVAVRLADETRQFTAEEHKRLARAARDLPGSISVSEVAESRVAAARAALESESARRDLAQERLTERLKGTELLSAKRELGLRLVHAPIDGVVVDVMRRPGEWVEPGEDLVRLIRVDRLRAEAMFDFKSLAGAKQGDAATVGAESAAGAPITVGGVVAFVSPEVNPINGQVRVWVEFDNPEGRFTPGMRATVRIAAGRTSATNQPNATGGAP